MDYKQSPALIVIVVALLLLTPLVYGQLLPNNAIVTGKICCASSGNCPLGLGSVGIPGVRATLNCTTLLDSVVTLAQGVTGPTGVLSIPFNNILSPFVLDPVINDNQLLRCAVLVRLPLNSTVCPILSTVNGVLVGIPTLVQTFIIPVPSFIRNLTVPFFIKVTV